MANPFKSKLSPQGKLKKNKWSFEAPSYDNRSSDSIAAGDYYGTGYRNPVGKVRSSSMDGGPVPKKSLRVPPTSVV